MNIKIIGKPFGSGIAQAKDKLSEDARGRKTIETTYRTLWLGWINSAPTRGSSHPIYPKAVLNSRSAQQITPGWLCDVTLNYVEPEPDDGNPPANPQLPPNEYTETANEIDMPIESHPDFASFATEANGAIFNAAGDFKGWQPDSEFAGYMTFKVGSITESETTYFWNQPESCGPLVGKRAAANYLIVSGSIARKYPYWTRTINRIYSSVPWNTTVYPA